MKTKKTWVALLAALAAIAIAAGCGGDDNTTNAGSKSSAKGNATDAAFIADMPAHHRGAIEVAKLAQKRAEHPEIPAARGRHYLRPAGRNLGDEDHPREHAPHGRARQRPHGYERARDGHGHGHDRPGGRQAVRQGVHRRDGYAPPARHRDGQAAAGQGRAARLRRMADDIITAQTREIAQMRQWRNAWFTGRRPART